MSKTWVVVCGVLLVIAMTIGGAGMQYISAANYANEAEAGIVATYKNNENLLAGYSTKIVELAAVPAEKTKHLKEVINAEMTGRYGSDGSKAIFQFISENAAGTVTDDLYREISQAIRAGRDEFKNGQTRMASLDQSYATNRGYIWKGFWIRLAGYPKIDLTKYTTLVSSSHAKEAFDTKIDNGVQLFK